MVALVRVKRVRDTAKRNHLGEWEFEHIFNREIYPALNSILDLTTGTEGAILQTRDGGIVWYPTGDPGALLQVFSDGLPTWTETLPADQRRSLIWNPNTQQWTADNHSYRPAPLPGANPTGWPATGPNIRLSFAQNSLVDTSGNGLNATIEAGTERYTYFSPTISAFKFDGSTNLIVTGSQPLLALTGEMTVVFGLIARTVGAAQQFVCWYEDLQELEVDNTLWSIFYESSGAVTFISESGAGVNATHTVNSWMEIGQPSLVGLTRYASGSVQFFLNQGDWGTLSAPLTTPTGGSNARFRLGGREASTSFFSGTMSGFNLYPFSITSLQWKQMYNACFGYWQGFTSET